MAVVASIGVVLLGSLPVTELLKRILRRPLAWFGSKTGMNNTSVAGLLIAMVSVLPAIVLIKDMDKRGRIVNAAFMVCAASALAAQLGFVAGVETSLLPLLLVSKFSGGICGALLTNLSAWLSGIWFDPALIGGTFEKIADLLPFIHAVEMEKALFRGNFEGAGG